MSWQLDIPSFGAVLVLHLRIQLSLPGLRALHKRAVLVMELAQHAGDLPLIDYTTALASPAGVARTVLPRSNVSA